ncbi:MAG: hypothetical protein AAF548_15955 [Actinomycetota bacterium]
MAFSLRQWLIIGALVVGFGIAAIIAASGTDTVSPADDDFDQIEWCTNAAGLTGARPYLDGEVDTATAEDFDRVKEAFYAVEVIAPNEIWPEIRRLSDFAFVAVGAFDDNAWPDAYAAAQDNVNVGEVAAAVEVLDAELALCGVDFG